MRYDDFVGAVARRAECEPHRAEAASKAVVQALAEQVGTDVMSRVAAQLPGELKERVPPVAGTRGMTLEEFFGRVTELGGVEEVGDPAAPTRAVLATLYDAVGHEQLREAVVDLPRAYGEVLPEEVGPVGLDAFLARVEEYAQLVSRDEAQEVTQATLAALAERVSTGQARDIAGWLPAPLRPYLHAASEPATPFDSRVLIRQVMDVRHLDTASAERQVRAVLAAVREQVSEKELSDTLQQLPPEMARLFR